MADPVNAAQTPPPAIAPKPITNGASGKEGPSEPKPGEPTKAELDDKQRGALFASLTKKERAIQARDRELKAKEAELTAKYAQVEAYEKAKANAKRRPLEWAKESGLSYDDITQAVMQDGKPTPELMAQAMDDKLAEFERRLAEKDKAAETARAQQQDAARQRVLTDFRAEVANYVKGKGDEFELTNLQNAHQLVVSVIEEEHARTGKLLTTHEAAAKVEGHLESQVKKLQSAKKFQVKGPPQPQGDRKSADTAQSRTLSNDMTVSTATLHNSAKSEKERVARALAALSK